MSDGAEVNNSEKSDNNKTTKNGKAQAAITSQPRSTVPRRMHPKGATISPVSSEKGAGEKSTQPQKAPAGAKSNIDSRGTLLGPERSSDGDYLREVINYHLNDGVKDPLPEGDQEGLPCKILRDINQKMPNADRDQKVDRAISMVEDALGLEHEPIVDLSPNGAIKGTPHPLSGKSNARAFSAIV